VSAERTPERSGRARATLVSLGYALIGLAGSPSPVAHAAGPPQPSTPVQIGDSVGTALQGLQGRDLQIIYSSALVPPGLKVTVQPQAPDPRAQAREILAPHSLDLRPVAPGLYAVVRVSSPRRTAPPTDSVETLHGPQREPDRPIDAVVVAGTREGNDGPDIATAHLLDRAQLDAQPGLREDAFRGAGRVPGITLNGLSAAPHVRGGGADELLALVDGFPIRQPYHLSGYQSVFSLIDPQLISSMDVFTGGFPARYGGRMSGVFDMRLADTYGESTRGLGASFFNANARGSGPLPGVDGWDWLGMARYGTLGIVLDALAPEVGEPSYGDFVGRLRWVDSANREIAAYAVWSRDALDISNKESTEHAQVDSRSLYTWLRGVQRWGGGSQLTLWLGNTQLENTRNGVAHNPLINQGTLLDDRRANIWDLRGRWSMPLGPHQELELGGEWSRGSAEYNYRSMVMFTPAVAQMFGKRTRRYSRFDESPSTRGLHFFVSHRWEITDAVTAETGLRAERDAGFGLNPATLVDPRVAVRWAFRPDMQLRMQWGRFHQSQDVTELRIQDGVRAFDHPQRSDHLILGLEHRMPSGVALRAEAFSKRQLDPQVRLENLFDALSILPELEPDRVRVAPDASELRGLELSAERRGRPLSWWASFTWSQALDDIRGAKVPRSWDQRNAVMLGASWTRGPWDFAATGTAHSGWPITTLTTNPKNGRVVGLRSDDRVGTFFSLDMRLRYRWILERSDLSVALEVTNALNHNNACCRALAATENPDGTTSFSTRQVDWLPVVPSLSVQWSR
jgi:hypothetical protein